MRLLTATALALLSLAPVRAAAQTLRVGTGEGADAELFTRVAGAVVDRFGRLVVLDQGESRLVVFAPDGRRTQLLGRRGGGPGEFGEARGVALTGSGQLLVVDPVTSRLTGYDLSRADSVRYRGTWRIRIRGLALCASGARVFVQDEDAAGMIHELRLGEQGVEVVGAFGAPQSRRPGMDRPALRLPMTNGILACAPTAGLVAFASTQLGEVRIWRADGREVGFVTLAPFVPIGYGPTDRGVQYVWPESGETQQVEGLAIDDAGVVTGTVATLTKGSEAKRFETWRVDATGAVRSRTPASGWLLSATSTRVVCAREGEMGVEVSVGPVGGGECR